VKPQIRAIVYYEQIIDERLDRMDDYHNQLEPRGERQRLITAVE